MTYEHYVINQDKKMRPPYGSKRLMHARIYSGFQGWSVSIRAWNKNNKEVYDAFNETTIQTEKLNRGLGSILYIRDHLFEVFLEIIDMYQSNYNIVFFWNEKLMTQEGTDELESEFCEYLTNEEKEEK